MQSYEVLREAAEDIGVKALAAQLRLSPALVYKWCQESKHDDPDRSGARNPLDRLSEIVRATGRTSVVNWLCNEADGFFVKNPVPTDDPFDAKLLQITQRLVKQFGDMLLAVSSSIADDGQIDAREADQIRETWEALKGSAETFVVACEHGNYRQNA